LRRKAGLLVTVEGVKGLLRDLLQCLKTQLVFRFLLFQQSKTGAHDLARVLVTATLDALLDELRLVLGQVDILRRHWDTAFVDRVDPPVISLLAIFVNGVERHFG
jgi:hypothetical protein